AVVAARAGLDGDGLCRADRIAEHAGDAALFPMGIAAKRVLAPEARRDRPLLERIVERGLRLEEVAHPKEERRYELPEKGRAGGVIQSHGAILSGEAGRTALTRRISVSTSHPSTRTTRCRTPPPSRATVRPPP